MTGPQGLHDIARRPWDVGSDLLPAAALAGAQVRAVADQLSRLPSLDRPRALVVVGSGAPAAVALLTAVIGPGCPVPIVAAPSLPAWVGPLDVVVVLATTVDDHSAAEALAVAVRRGASVITRCAADGPVPAMAGRAGTGVLVPTIAVPEALAAAGRLALLVGVAGAAGLLPAVDVAPAALADLADQVDGIAVACHPNTDFFVNPALLLAEHVLGGPPVFIGLDPVGDAVAEHAVLAFAALGARPVTALHSTDVPAAAPLVARMAAGSADLFADPFADDEPDWVDPADRAAVVLVGTPDAVSGELLGGPGPTGRPPLAPDALPRALRLGADEVAVAGRPDDDPFAAPAALPGSGRAAGPRSPVQHRLAALLDLLARVDFAAVYTGLVTGARPPSDAPEGLGPAGAALFRPVVTAGARPEGPPGDRSGPVSGTVSGTVSGAEWPPRWS